MSISYRPGSPTEGAGLSAWLRFKAGVRRADSRAIARGAGFDVDDDEIIVCRDLESGTDSEGGYAVNGGLTAGIVAARDEFGVLRNRATIYPRETGEPFSVPTVDDTANYATVMDEEVDQTSGTHMSFNKADLRPLKIATKILRVSEELLEDATFDLESYLGKALGERCYRGQNFYATNGTGISGAQPGSILSGGTAAITAASETSIEASEIIDLCAALGTEYRNDPRACVMLNGTTLGLISRLIDGRGRYLLQEFANRPTTIQGLPIVLNPDMPSVEAGKSPIAVGLFSYLAISEVKGVRVQWLRELFAQAGQVGVRAYLRTNSAVTNASAIQLLTMDGGPS